MDKKILICHNGKLYFWEKSNLYEYETNRKISKLNYLFASNYGTKPYDILAIETDVFFIYPDTAKKISTDTLLEEKNANYFYTEDTGDENGNDIYVFIQRGNPQKTALLGRSLQQITEDVYKIGKIAYQVIDGQLYDMCPCTDFEISGNLLEIQTGDPGCSKLVCYRKSSAGWRKINEWERRNLHSRNIEMNF